MTRLARTLTIAVLAATIAAPAQARPAPPQHDPFYRPDPGYELTAPGTVLRSRPVRAALFGAYSLRGSAWQLLYRTTDTKGAPQATVTTVLVPLAKAPNRGNRPLVSYQPAEDSAAPQCAPSYGLLRGTSIQNPVAQVETVLISGLLARGYAVTVPDYEGPNSAYTAGRQAGQATLDGVRATLAFSPAGLRGSATPLGMWGYSGGALATGWANELQPGYAPELRFAGVAAGGLPVSLTDTFRNVNRSVFSGIGISAITGLSQAYPELATLLDEILTARGRGAVAYAKRHCNSDVAARYPLIDINKLTTLGRPLEHPVAKSVLADTLLGKHAPAVAPASPTYVYHAIHDELVSSREVDELLPRYCAGGTPVRYDRDAVSEHVSLAITGGFAAIGWLSDRLEGRTPVPTGCQTRTTTSTVAAPRSLQELVRFLLRVPKTYR
ncbi:MAG: hypothetical protein JHC95_09150 [Solirubrobacteraceae bacterium]|nr:hypothetical protein [Solirubrobacteraceae bacterium]